MRIFLFNRFLGLDSGDNFLQTMLLECQFEQNSYKLAASESYAFVWIQVTVFPGSTVTLEVCSEETLHQVMMRYMPHNSHLHSYTWRYLGRGLCVNKTLAQNGIPDERERFNDVALPENAHIPAILIYYDDDLTEGKNFDLRRQPPLSLSYIVNGEGKNIVMKPVFRENVIKLFKSCEVTKPHGASVMYWCC